MARFAISMKDMVAPFAATRSGLPPLTPAVLIGEFRPCAEEPNHDACGPGWYQSSRELRCGLEVRDLPLDEWLDASYFGGIPLIKIAA